MVRKIELHWPNTVVIHVTDADCEGRCADIRDEVQPIVESFAGRILRLGKRGRKWNELGLNVFPTARGEIRVWIVPYKE